MSYSFWEIVGMAKEKAGDDWESRPDALKNLLLKLPPEEICRFDVDYHKKLIEAYRWDLWGAAYLINGGCSDDGFDYFRDFLISEGREVYEAALKNPDSLAELGDMEDAELESYRYVIYEAYEELTGKGDAVRGYRLPGRPCRRELGRGRFGKDVSETGRQIWIKNTDRPSRWRVKHAHYRDHRDSFSGIFTRKIWI